jgi:hypothetical protein
MTKWVVECTNCTVEFEHSQISDVGMARLYLPPKPQVPPNGAACVCSNCGKRVSDFRTDLVYGS